MKLFLKRNLFNMFLFVATIAATKHSWFGTFEMEKPKSLR